MYHITCLNCSKEHVAKRANSKFCCSLCRNQYNRKHRGYKQICDFCGKEFKNYEKRKFCSFECSTDEKKKSKIIRELIKAIHSIPKESSCLYCGNDFLKVTHDKMYCTKNCSRLDFYYRNKKLLERKCEECGVAFSTSDSRLRCCSKDCSNKRNWRNAYLVRRRRVRENGRIDRGISVRGIMDRDGTRCYLCNNEVDIESHYTSDYYPTIEHVIPISKGGTHTWDNVKLAHRLCNMYKTDRVINSQQNEIQMQLF